MMEMRLCFLAKAMALLKIDEAHGGIGGRLDVEDFGERGEQSSSRRDRFRPGGR